MRCSVSGGLEWQKIWIPFSATRARVRTALGQILPYVPDTMGSRTEPAPGGSHENDIKLKVSAPGNLPPEPASETKLQSFPDKNIVVLAVPQCVM